MDKIKEIFIKIGKFIKKYSLIIFNFIKKYVIIIYKKIKEFIKKIIEKIKKFISNKKEKRKVRKENNEKTKLQIFFITIGSFIGNLFIKIIKHEKSLDKEIKSVNRTINNIEHSYKEEYSPSILKTYKKQIDKKITRLETLEIAKTREESKEIKDNINKLEKLKEKVLKREKELKEDIIDTSFSEEIEDKEKLNKKVINNIKTGIGSIKKKVNNEKKKEEKLFENKIKEFNNTINITYNEVRVLNNEKTKDEDKYKEIKQKIINLKNEYIKVINSKKAKDINYKKIEKIDPNHLIYHDKAIDNLLEYIESSVNKIKKENNNKTEIINNEQPKENLNFNDNQMKLILNTIKKDVNLTIKDIDIIKREVNLLPTNVRKNSLLDRITKFFNHSINIGISLIPFGIFKNKLLATFTSGLILNNRIKGINSIFTKEQYDTNIYENIINSINSKTDCLEKTNYILLDTVDEIDKLMIQLNEKYLDNEDSKILLNNLEEMKLDLLEENLKIETMLEEVNGLKKNKVKKKILKRK